MNTEILLDHEPVGDGGYVVRALLRVRGEAPEPAGRVPLNLALVLDRSGSMGALHKLERAREAAALLVRRLGDDDRISLVAYDDDVLTVAARARGAEREALLARIAAIAPGGMTNLSGGWLRGRELVATERVDGGVNRVLLLTDGLANVGITEPGRLRDLVAAAAADGVTTTTIGFGADYDEHLLATLADAGGGATHYIEEAEQAPAVFAAEVQGLMGIAAQNVAVTVAPAPAVSSTTVRHRYPREQTADGALRLALGDLYALEPRSLLVEFLVDDVAGAGDVGAPIHVATLTVEGHVLLPGGGVEKRTLTLPIAVTPTDGAVVQPEVRRELLLLEASREREAALEDRARGEFADGARRLRRIARRLAACGIDDADIRDEIEDLDDMAARFEEQTVTGADAKWLHQRAYSASHSRLTTMDPVREARARRRRRDG